MPPCWWEQQSEVPYSEQIATFEEHMGAHQQWKAFYFAFGMHWPKLAVASHNNEKSVWMVIHGTIFDMTHFDDHPGRLEPFMQFAGLDATAAFEAMGHDWSTKTQQFGDELIVQSLQIPREGNIIRPQWLMRQEAVPRAKVWLFKLLLFDVRQKLSYHDFW